MYFNTWFWIRVCGVRVCVCWLSHIQQCCCGCKTASGISMYKQAYKWSTIWLFIFILLTVNKAEQALTPSNKWRPTHANSAAPRNQEGLFELRSILFGRWQDSPPTFCLLSLFSFLFFYCKAINVFMYSEIGCNECDFVCLCCRDGFYGSMCVHVCACVLGLLQWRVQWLHSYSTHCKYRCIL